MARPNGITTRGDQGTLRALRDGTLDQICEEVKEHDAAIALVAAKAYCRFATLEDGLRILAQVDDLKLSLADAGFGSREELVAAVNSLKPKTAAPVGMVYALERHSQRAVRQDENKGQGEALPVYSIPAPAQRTAEQESDAPEVELGK